MAKALEEVLGERTTGGIVNVPYGDRHQTHIVKRQEASHPIPNEAGVGGSTAHVDYRRASARK